MWTYGHFKSISNRNSAHWLTHSLTRVKSRDASASKKLATDSIFSYKFSPATSKAVLKVRVAKFYRHANTFWVAVFAIMSGWNTGFVAIVSGQDMCDVVISVSLWQRMVFILVIQQLHCTTISFYLCQELLTNMMHYFWSLLITFSIFTYPKPTASIST